MFPLSSVGVEPVRILEWKNKSVVFSVCARVLRSLHTGCLCLSLHHKAVGSRIRNSLLYQDWRVTRGHIPWMPTWIFSWYCLDFLFFLRCFPLSVSLSGQKCSVYFWQRKTTLAVANPTLCEANKVSHLLVFMSNHMQTQNQRCVFTNATVARVCMCVIMCKCRSQCDHTGPVRGKSSHVGSNSRFKSL